jgi:hypothetical protein
MLANICLAKLTTWRRRCMLMAAVVCLTGWNAS